MKEYKDGVWYPSKPVDKERVRIYNGAGGFTEKSYTSEISIFIELIPNERIVAGVGESFSFSTQISNKEGDVIEMETSLLLPLKRVGGSVEKTLMLDFIKGICTRNISFDKSGEYTVTEDTLTSYPDTSTKFKVGNLNITIYE